MAHNGKKLKIVELYAGTGRSIEPFKKWRAAETSLLVDFNQHAANVYKHNYPKTRYETADLSNLSSQSLIDMSGGRVDILLGCPPCQGYSDIGSRESNDPRNLHFARFFKYAHDLRPLAFAIENVPLAAASKGFFKLTKLVEKIGYSWTATIANAALWGSCQSRQRFLFVAVRNDAGSAPKVPQVTHGAGKYFSYSTKKLVSIADDKLGMLGTTPGTRQVARLLPENSIEQIGEKSIPRIVDIIGDLPKVDSTRAKKLGHISWAHTPGILKRMEGVEEGGRWIAKSKNYFSQTYGRLHRKGLARTITTYFPNPGSGRNWHPTENRSITLREAARIQGFPDDFEFIGNPSSNCTLVGNALDSSLANLTYRIIRNSLG